jgi:hypothetical protein
MSSSRRCGGRLVRRRRVAAGAGELLATDAAWRLLPAAAARCGRGRCCGCCSGGGCCCGCCFRQASSLLRRAAAPCGLRRTVAAGLAVSSAAATAEAGWRRPRTSDDLRAPSVLWPHAAPRAALGAPRAPALTELGGLNGRRWAMAERRWAERRARPGYRAQVGRKACTARVPSAVQ